MADNFHQLLSKNLSRKEFLALAGAAILAVTGITGMMKSLNENILKSQKTYPVQKSGFGSSSYGGKGTK